MPGLNAILILCDLEVRVCMEAAMKPVWLGVLLAAFPLDFAFAWGEDGHSIVAEIAQRRLNDTARAAVDKVLKHGSMASVANWADDVKFTARPETKAWHFVDIP